MGVDRFSSGILVGLWSEGLPPPRFYTDVARSVEALGFDALFFGDHVFFNVPNPETLTLLAAVSAVTHRIAVGTGVLLLALRQPAVVAKELATIDYLSEGRLVVGVGVGGEFELEWRALGVPLGSRGARTDEHLALMQALWSGRRVEFDGRFCQMRDVVGSPSPTRPGGPPIWIGGRSDRALARAARYDGWCAYALAPRAISSSVERLRGMGVKDGYRVSAVVFTCVADDEATARRVADETLSGMYGQPFGRFLDKFCAVGTQEQVEERLREFLDAGVSDLLLAPQVPREWYPDQLERLAAATASLRRLAA